MYRRLFVVLIFAAVGAGFFSSGAAVAGNGHFLHGVGAVNSSLGGAGVALAPDALGALNLNPALLTSFDGDRLEFGMEALKQSLSVSSRVGPFSGTTEDDTGLATLPAFGWVHHREESRFAYGFGFLALAGFQTDYPQDNTNPVLAPQPMGFGRTLADYSFAKIPIVLAYQATPKLSLGFSLNIDQAGLDSSPFAGATPDCNAPTSCFYPSATPKDTVMGFGAQIGLVYEISPKLTFGISYTSPQEFETFEWNSTASNPNLPNFGQGRTLRFDLDSPQRLTLGLGVQPNDRLSVALDLKWINYSDTDGFSGGRLDPATGAIDGLGWEDIVVIAAGMQYRLASGADLRVGVNISESAVPERLAFFNIQAPAIQENHLTLGAGFPLSSQLTLNVGYYHVFSAQVEGAFQSPMGPVPGTEVASEISIDSALVALAFQF